jgi:hypothetical protein
MIISVLLGAILGCLILWASTRFLGWVLLGFRGHASSSDSENG